MSRHIKTAEVCPNEEKNYQKRKNSFTRFNVIFSAHLTYLACEFAILKKRV